MFLKGYLSSLKPLKTEAHIHTNGTIHYTVVLFCVCVLLFFCFYCCIIKTIKLKALNPQGKMNPESQSAVPGPIYTIWVPC